MLFRVSVMLSDRTKAVLQIISELHHNASHSALLRDAVDLMGRQEARKAGGATRKRLQDALGPAERS